MIEDPYCGKEFYVPFEDEVASISDFEGKPVHARRAPNFAKMLPGFIAAGGEKYLPYNHGRFCFFFGRKMGSNAPFDRQYEVGDARFCYYRNRIWDK